MSDTEISPNPFPGLRPFNADETHLFFGRDEPTDGLLQQLGQSRFLTVVGVSGSGKSSLVRCGVLPALHGGFLAEAGSDWRVAMLRPGNDPIGELARALARSRLYGTEGSDEQAPPMDQIIETVLRRGALGLVDAARQARLGANEPLLVVVDQFEELFRYEGSIAAEHREGDKAAFVKLLLEAGGADLPIYVVLTLRSDFLGECAQYRDLPEAISRGLFFIPRMTREQLRETITGPVAVAGGEISPLLVNRLLNDVGDDPAQLPILQHSLMRTWGEWETGGDASGPIDLMHYETAGGLDGALDQHLDGILGELTEPRQGVAKRLFQRLTEVTPEGKKIRRDATVSQLCRVASTDESDVTAVIETFRREGRTFLMPPVGTPLEGDTLIDISHESLIHGWKKLRGWMEKDAESAQIYRPLAEAAALWKTEGVGHSAYQDPELQRALNWYEGWESEGAAQAWAEPFDRRAADRTEGFQGAKEFLLWSERQRMWGRLRKAGWVALAFAAVATWAIVSNLNARREARAQRIAFAATRPDPLEGILLLEELQGQGDVDGRGAEVALDLAQHAIPVAVPAPYPSAVEKIMFDRDGERVLTLFADRTTRLVDAATGDSLALPAALEAEQGRIANLIYTDESRFALYTEDRALRTQDGVLVQVPEGRDYSTFSPDGSRFLALYTSPGVVCVWDLSMVDNADPVRNGSACQAAVSGTPASSSGTPEGEAPSGGGPASATLIVRHPDVLQARFSSDGRLLATRSPAEEEGLRVWELDAASEIGRVSGRGVRGVAFSRSAPPLMATAHDGPFARVWELPGDPSSADLRCELYHQGRVNSVAFDRAGDRLLSASDDGTARIWDLERWSCTPGDDPSQQPSALAEVLAGHDGPIDAAWYNLADSLVTTISRADSTVRVWDLHGSNRGRVLRGQVPLTAALGPEGRWIATGDASGQVRIYGPGGTRWFGEFPPEEDIWSVDVSPDGRRVALGDGRRLVRLSSQAGAESADTLPGFDAVEPPPSPVLLLAYSPNGRRLAAALGELADTTVVWTPGRNPAREVLAHPSEIWSLDFDLDGAHALAGYANGWFRRWDAETGQVTDSVRTGENPVAALARTVDGFTVTGDSQGALRIWGRDGERTDLEMRFTAINDLAFSPDGRRLAAATPDTVLVWSLQEGADVWRTTALGHEQILPGGVGVHFLSDSTLVTASREGRVRIWHATRPEPLFGFDMGAGSPSVSNIRVSADGSVVVSYHEDGAVRVWPLSWDGLLYNLREHATRACLDARQRQTLLGESSSEARTKVDACRDRYQKADGSMEEDG
jgi:WD40 repeat protein